MQGIIFVTYSRSTEMEECQCLPLVENMARYKATFGLASLQSGIWIGIGTKRHLDLMVKKYNFFFDCIGY